jgi:hypothetical protein
VPLGGRADWKFAARSCCKSKSSLVVQIFIRSIPACSWQKSDLRFLDVMPVLRACRLRDKAWNCAHDGENTRLPDPCIRQMRLGCGVIAPECFDSLV